MTTSTATPQPKFWRRASFWGPGLFWSWNLIYTTVFIFGFSPFILVDLWSGVRENIIPGLMVFNALLLIIIPIIAMILAATVFRKRPADLLTFGYGIEGPLMLGLLLRFFAIRQMTPGMLVLLCLAIAGVSAVLWKLLDDQLPQRATAWRAVALIGLTFCALLGLYLGAFLLFYVIPLAGLLLHGTYDLVVGIPEFFRTTKLTDIAIFAGYTPFMTMSLIMWVYSATLFIGLPIVMPILFTRQWWQGMRQFANKNNWVFAGSLAITGIAIALGSVLYFKQQPQHAAFALLQTPPETAADVQHLIDNEDIIREGLLNAYLASNRYFSARGDVQHVFAMWSDDYALNLTDDAARNVQGLYEALASPILYEPFEPYTLAELDDFRGFGNMAFVEDPLKAAELYETFFDEPIAVAEKPVIVNAVKSTWDVAQAEQGWLEVDDREVHLNEQAITITEHGDWAEVELYEVYQNQTGLRQEVIYYFSLPESAVITGVWLGNSADRAERFEHRVSPRGAAQQLYREEVQRNIDPALVEQLGPRQYRLRIFPIEPKRQVWQGNYERSVIEEGDQLHMWLTYATVAADNAWPLPQLAELRNVYWTADTVRTINGAAVDAGEQWFPTSMPATEATTAQTHTASFSNGQTVTARPAAAADNPDLPSTLSLAVVLDRSRSMNALRTAVEAEIDMLRDLGVSVDIFLTASEYHAARPEVISLADFAAADVVYFGGQDPAQLLTQFDALRSDTQYDAALILTDATGYQLGEGESNVPTFDMPVWMVHLDGLPLGYDDPTLEALQASGGGTVNTVAAALQRLSVALAGNANLDVYDGYVWEVSDTQTATQTDFAPIAARRLILADMQQNRASLDALDTLDALHEIAVEHSIVTPFSSMIVLINTQQQRRLDELENADDRFDREHEDVGETQAPPVTGVPEPEEWVLIILSIGLLGWLIWQRKTGKTPQFAIRRL